MEIWRLYVRDDIVLLTTVFLIYNFHRRGLQKDPLATRDGFLVVVTETVVQSNCSVTASRKSLYFAVMKCPYALHFWRFTRRECTAWT